MRKAILASLAIGAVIASPAHSRRMERILVECDGAGDFPAYEACIRQDYAMNGNFKKDGTVWAFYSLLAEISEAWRKSQATPEPMSNTLARANVYRAWQSTINASNQRETGKICSMKGNTLTCE